MISVWSPRPTWWKERTNSWKLSSICVVIHRHVHIHTKRMYYNFYWHILTLDITEVLCDIGFILTVFSRYPLSFFHSEEIVYAKTCHKLPQTSHLIRTLASLFAQTETNITYSKITEDLSWRVKSKRLHWQCVWFLKKLEWCLDALPRSAWVFKEGRPSAPRKLASGKFQILQL